MVCFFFLKKEKAQRGQAGHGVASTHPALMVPKKMKSRRVGGLLLKKGKGAGRARGGHRPPSSHGSKKKNEE